MMSTMETTESTIAEAATAQLANSSINELRSLRVDGTATRLELSGRVRSFYHKQLAQETVRLVADGMQVVNRVDVCNGANL